MPILMLGMRLSCKYDSVRRFTKSTQKSSTLMVAVSRCFDFSGLDAMSATLDALFLPFLCAQSFSARTGERDFIHEEKS